MTARLLLMLLGLSFSGCVVRAHPLVVRPGIRVAPAHVHFAGCGHHAARVIVVK